MMVAAVTTSAPLAPKMVNCSSTSMPHPVGDDPPGREQDAEQRRPRPRQAADALAEQHALGGADSHPGDGALDDEVDEVGVVADDGRAHGEADHEPCCGGGDPVAGGRAAEAQAPAWAAPRMAPVMAPPISAAVSPSTGPEIR